MRRTAYALDLGEAGRTLSLGGPAAALVRGGDLRADPLRHTNAVLRAAQLACALDALERHLIAECGDECECAACRTHA